MSDIKTPVIDAHLAFLTGLRAETPAGWRYSSTAALLAAEGTRFPEPVLSDERGLPKQCFKNAGNAAINNHRRFLYCEGVAVISVDLPLPVEHAWIWDLEEGRAVEVTWETPGPEYLGIAFTTDFMRGMALARGVWGILDSRVMLTEEADPDKYRVLLTFR